MPAMSKLAPALAVGLVAIVIFIAFMTDESEMSAPAVPAGISAPQQGQQAMRPAQSPVPPQQTSGGGNAAPMLEGLVAGLEAKVKADPDNVNNKLLLAQTYAEIGRFEDSIKLLREVQGNNGTDTRVKLVSAMVLGKSENVEHLNEALNLLTDVVKQEPNQKGQAVLHKGRIQKKLGSVEDARKTWQEGVAQMPENDPLRKEIEKELANI